MKDSLGDRMKEQYENRTRHMLPRRTYTIVRLDGKSFHSLTRGCEKPFDAKLVYAMDETAKYLCENIQGAQFAYVQSDEISILLTDFAKPTTSAWFDGNIQKMASVSASMAAAKFNQLRLLDIPHTNGEPGEFFKYACVKNPLAAFDSRVFTIPDPTEVHNYFRWRQQDCTRNSVTMVAQSLYSHKELHGKSQSDMHEMIHQAGQNWNDYRIGCKRGRVIRKESYDGYDLDTSSGQTVQRTRWMIDEPPIFMQEPSYLEELIPHYE